MYEILKSVISAGGYKLADIQHKVKKLYILGDLTEEQMDELLAMASDGISADAERPETMALIHTLAEKVEALEVRMAAYDGGNGEEQGGYPAWKPWDGISKDYQKGAIVSHNGELWRSDYAGKNVWEPGTPGTESLWVKYIEEE